MASSSSSLLVGLVTIACVTVEHEWARQVVGDRMGGVERSERILEHHLHIARRHSSIDLRDSRLGLVDSVETGLSPDVGG